MKVFGYAGGMLQVDLTNRTVKRERLDADLVRNYLGGMGLNGRLAYDLIKPGIDPLSPDNVLLYSMGPFVGTTLPGMVRTNIAAKSPLTGFIGLSGGGISIGPMLKYAGYDQLIISGRADKPVYLVITNDRVEIKDAGELWGQDTLQATDEIRHRLGEYWVSCIGPAGENRVPIACIIDNKNSMHARTGLGAVMGSKNLKAIAVQGTNGIQVSDAADFRKLAGALRETVKKSPAIDIWRYEGKIIDSYMGGLKRSPGFTQKEFASRIWKTYFGCLGCVVGDKGVLQIRDGKYEGLTLKLSNPWGTPAFFESCGCTNYDQGVKCAELGNRLGLDCFTLHHLIAFAQTLYEQGILTKEDAGGPEWKRDADTTFRLIKQIAYKEGIGELLGKGQKEMVRILGGDTYKQAGHIKGLEPMYDMRTGLIVENFGHLTNPRGGHHARSYSITYAPRKSETIRRFCLGIGVPEEALDRVAPAGDFPDNFNLPRLTKWSEDYNSAYYSLGGCDRTPITPAYNLSVLCRLLRLTTGMEFSPAELRNIGERIWNVHRMFNVREGASRADDLPPYKWIHEDLRLAEENIFPPVPETTIQALLNEYYEERGWDVATGNPTVEKLKILGLEKEARDLERSRAESRRLP
jgi:aldehyde:ferredoxin oxidoreductase